MLLEETPGQSNLYIYEPGSDTPLARIDQSEGEAERKAHYFHTDQIGTTLEMTDVDGQIVWLTTYKSWGEVETLAVSEVEQNLRFHGQYFNASNPLIWLDPLGLGSFNSPVIYDVHAESRLPADMYRMSDGKHFREANRQLYY